MIVTPADLLDGHGGLLGGGELAENAGRGGGSLGRSGGGEAGKYARNGHQRDESFHDLYPVGAPTANAAPVTFFPTCDPHGSSAFAPVNPQRSAWPHRSNAMTEDGVFSRYFEAIALVENKKGFGLVKI